MSWICKIQLYAIYKKHAVRFRDAYRPKWYAMKTLSRRKEVYIVDEVNCRNNKTTMEGSVQPNISAPASKANNSMWRGGWGQGHSWKLQHPTTMIAADMISVTDSVSMFQDTSLFVLLKMWLFLLVCPQIIVSCVSKGCCLCVIVLSWLHNWIWLLL